jgi:hypothetical protein
LHITQVLIIKFEIINDLLEELHAAINKSVCDQYVYRRITNAGAAGGYSEWPTMELLIVHNTRFIAFVHGDGMDFSCTSMVCPEGFFLHI